MYSEKPKISIDEHMSKLDESMRGIFQEIRSFVLSLGSNVVEEVRPHRIVYAKSFNFRTFLDIEPTGNALVMSIKTGAKGTSTKLVINSAEQIPDLKELVQDTYTKI